MVHTKISIQLPTHVIYTAVHKRLHVFIPYELYVVILLYTKDGMFKHHLQQGKICIKLKVKVSYLLPPIPLRNSVE